MLMMLGLASLLLWCWVKRASPDVHDAGACLPPAVVLGARGSKLLETPNLAEWLIQFSGYLAA